MRVKRGVIVIQRQLFVYTAYIISCLVLFILRVHNNKSAVRTHRPVIPNSNDRDVSPLRNYLRLHYYLVIIYIS